MKEFGQWLKFRREIAGMSLKDLARISGVSLTQISLTERGKSEPHMVTIEALTWSFNLSVGDALEQAGMVNLFIKGCKAARSK